MTRRAISLTLLGLALGLSMAVQAGERATLAEAKAML
jgi:hypothetical protein